MSAPMSSRLPSKETITSLIRANFILAISIILATSFTLVNQSLFSLVKYKLIVSKVFIFFIVLFNVAFYNFILRNSGIIQKQTSLISKIRIIIKYGCLLFCSSLSFHVVAVLFGAPLLESSAETFHFGMIVTAVVTLPILCVLGTNTSHLIRVFAQNSPELGAESIVYFSTICSLIGAWLGAFPIPLDWDRPWQEWPVTCIVGTLLGYCSGIIIGIGHLYANYYRIKRLKIT